MTTKKEARERKQFGEKEKKENSKRDPGVKERKPSAGGGGKLMPSKNVEPGHRLKKIEKNEDAHFPHERGFTHGYTEPLKS